MIDFLGMLCLVTGSWVPGVYYGFYCQRSVARFYLTLVSTRHRLCSSSSHLLLRWKISSLSFICAAVCLVPNLRAPKWRHFRSTMFLALGLSGILPMKYAAMEFGVSQAHHQMGWGWFILEAVFYISGTAIYVLKFPERVSPGTFDLYGSSHQIFHVLVLLGAGAHLIGIVQAFDYNHGLQTRICSIGQV